jgi:hypothetical protein
MTHLQMGPLSRARGGMSLGKLGREKAKAENKKKKND